MNSPIASLSLFIASLFFFLSRWSVGWAQNQLERELINVPIVDLAAESKSKGDPARGASYFHSPMLGCSQCHRVDDKVLGLLGPNLSLWKTAPDSRKQNSPANITQTIVDAILRPSNFIDPKYASLRILTTDGEVITGLLERRDDDRIQIRTGPKKEEIRSIALSEIDTESKSTLSLMPSGLVNQLENRSQFYDLVAYVDAIVNGGPELAKSIVPSPQLVQAPLPEYESHLDHAGIVSSWNKKSLERGRKIYAGLCVQCHGTREVEGTLPTALRFGRAKFKNGNDPYSMYKTITHGYGLMLPQRWMVPQQKYDVIQFIREEFLKDQALETFFAVDTNYLRSLPKGDTKGPDPVYMEPWSEMDYGTILATTVEFGQDGSNIAQKALVIRLDDGPGGIARGKLWMAFEHDTLRWAAGWQRGQGFIDWRGIQFDGAHGIHPRATGPIGFENPTAPGWANPETGDFDDHERVVGRDGKRYGPLPATWGKYLGIDRAQEKNELRYRVDESEIRERAFAVELDNQRYLFGRTVSVGPRKRSLKMRVATLNGEILKTKYSSDTSSHLSIQWRNSSQVIQNFECENLTPNAHCQWRLNGNIVSLEWSPSTESTHCEIVFGNVPYEFTHADTQGIASSKNLSASKSKNPGTPEDFVSTSRTWFEGNGWAVDEFELPLMNRWKARVRITGLAFYPDQDAMAICTWDGDVWRVSGLESVGGSHPQIHWQRIATGLYQPLGILALSDGLMLTCRDQLVHLRDTDRDGLMDDHRCFNSDHQVTEHFHEFAMGLQQDEQGNFYYAKSARHALKAIVPHHGTLLRVSPDGSQTDILATGFRAANGVCLNPDGTFVVTDQEGHWNPKNRINWVKPGKFYGNMFGYHDVTDTSNNAMEQPLCWITNAFDRSPAELLWANSPSWGTLQGSLVNLSYGYGRLYVVPFEDVGGLKQGGMCALPIPDLPTGIVRGRFSPRDGQLYVGGMFAWASSRQDQEGGLYRIRRTGQSVDLPVTLKVKRDSQQNPNIEIGMSEPLDRSAAEEVTRYKVKVWDLLRSEKYGSNHLNEREIAVQNVVVGKDNKTLVLCVPDLKPTWGMSIELKIISADGRPITRVIHNTVHQIPN